MVKHRKVVWIVVAALALSLVGSGITWAAGEIVTAGSPFTSTVVALHSEKCLQSASGSGTGVEQRTCSSAATQRFTFTPVDGAFKITGVSKQGVTACLDVSGAGRTNGPRVILWADCHGRPNQRFQLHAVPGYPKSFTITAVHSGLCLDVYSGSPYNGAPIVTWACATPAAGNQTWRLTGIPDGTATTPASPTATAPPTVTAGSTTPPSVTGATPTAPTPSFTPPTAPTPTTPATQPAATTTTSTSTAPQSTTSPPAVSDNPAWGKEAPPSDATLSRAYQLILAPATGYAPRAGECSIAVHARYWTKGPDGLVYPTWHPAKDASGCSFGHEHGDDPRTSALFATTGWPAFGYTNQQLAPSNPSSQRDEDHVGHKVSVGNAIEVHQGGSPENANTTGPLTMTCDSLMKFHQGTHSPDALTNNLHELLYNVRCRYADDGSVIETRFAALVPLGKPGGFTAQQECSGEANKQIENVGKPSPADSPTGLVGRFIPDADCAAAVVKGDKDIFRMNEVWVAGLFANSFTPRMSLQIFPFFFVANPSRYFDPAGTGKIGRQLDLCYQGAPGFLCDQVRRATALDGGTKIAYDDPRSPFNGAQRLFGAGLFSVQNTGPTTWYTDAFGSRFTTTAFPGAIKQFISGNHAGPRDQGEIGGTFTNYAAKVSDGIHAPN